MLAKSLKYRRHIMMACTDKLEMVSSDGETASAKRTQRSMQAAGGIAFLLKLDTASKTNRCGWRRFYDDGSQN